MFEKLYRYRIGRLIASVVARPGISRAAGLFMDSRASKMLIKPFIKKNHIPMNDVLEEEYPSFNAFFTRRLKPGSRALPADEQSLASPSDGLLTVYPITKNGVVTVKGTNYTAETLLESSQIATNFLGGWMFVFRLTPAHYHRYSYPDSGEYVFTKNIPGVFHTVRPEALQGMPVFKKNTREYAFLNTDHFGAMIYMEVGAAMVGRIVNPRREGRFEKGEEKGRFEFGGSTIILMTEKGALSPLPEIVSSTESGAETPVQLHQTVAKRSLS
ncbi:MAG: phosphatidylserine decarboxylase [Clostridia bacterium]|nr:phosphatidylserine decarboxylase [Clostridia bacterium]